jgi:hypothetical protein
VNARTEATLAGAIRCAPECLVAEAVRAAPDDVLLAAVRRMTDDALYQWARALPNVVLLDIASALVVSAVVAPSSPAPIRARSRFMRASALTTNSGVREALAPPSARSGRTVQFAMAARSWA